MADLIEQGDLDAPSLIDAVQHFCEPLRRAEVDTVVLGCTHYPLLATVIAQVVGRRMALVDSAATTAVDVARTLTDAQLLVRGTGRGQLRLFATDDAERFARVGSAFMGEQMRAADVEVVDL